MISCSGKSLIPISFDVYSKFMNSLVPEDKLAQFNIKLDCRSNVKAYFVKLAGTDYTIYTGAIINLGSKRFPDVSDPMDLLMLFTLYGVKKAREGINFELKTGDVDVAYIKADKDFVALSSQLHFFMEKFRPLNDAKMQSQPVVQTASVRQVQTSSVQAQSQQAFVQPVQEVQQPFVQPVQSQSVQQQGQMQQAPVQTMQQVPLQVSSVVDAGSVEEVKKTKKADPIPVSPYKDVPLGDTPKIEVPADLDLRTV